MLQLNNLKNVKTSLAQCDVKTFKNPTDTFRKFISGLNVTRFRHIHDLAIEFTHPITVISGSNKIGKTSLLLLIACSHEKFLKIDATTPETTLREHAWNDVLRFTKHESDTAAYSYKMNWRIGREYNSGEGKRFGSKNSWTGLGKKSKAKRKNAKIKDFEVRLIDLDRVGPVRNSSRRLQTKVKKNTAIKRLHGDIEKAFSYIFDLSEVKIFQIGEHITKRCYLIEHEDSSIYSSYATASGEDAVINILVDIFESPENSLILIDELEAGFHPCIQRKLADIIQYVSWNHKKQFIITTHSPTLMSSFPQESRRFIEYRDDRYRVIQKISTMAAFSKMDTYSHPLLQLYCEDCIACFIIKKVISEINKRHPSFNKLLNIVASGPANHVKDNFLVHKRIFEKTLPKIGYCCIFDGDHKDKDGYKEFHENKEPHVFFLYPYEAPEKFLAKAYLATHKNAQLLSFFTHGNHHLFFKQMCAHGLASDEEDARNQCFDEFKKTTDYQNLEKQMYEFLIGRVKYFSSLVDLEE